MSIFNCVLYCVGSAWIDAFDYPWSSEAKNWLIILAIVHLEKPKGVLDFCKSLAGKEVLYTNFIAVKLVFENKWVQTGRKYVFAKGQEK
jgi:hypothetical protein